eukprot:1136319-Pelagomonas_calceolata.AAC.3
MHVCDRHQVLHYAQHAHIQTQEQQHRQAMEAMQVQVAELQYQLQIQQQQLQQQQLYVRPSLRTRELEQLVVTLRDERQDAWQEAENAHQRQTDAETRLQELEQEKEQEALAARAAADVLESKVAACRKHIGGLEAEAAAVTVAIKATAAEASNRLRSLRVVRTKKEEVLFWLYGPWCKRAPRDGNTHHV